MDQSKKEEGRLRHSKEDKKMYRKRRKERRKQAKKASQAYKMQLSAAVSEPKQLMKVPVTSRAHAIVKMAMGRKNPRSTFLASKPKM